MKKTYVINPARAFGKKEDIEIPQYKCNTCMNRCGNTCNVLNRHIEMYNKCFNHSDYPQGYTPREIKSKEELVG